MVNGYFIPKTGRIRGLLWNKVIASSRRQFATLPTTSTPATSYPFDHTHLPSETIYLLDGTYMLYYAYFSKSTQLKFGDALFQPKFASEWLAKQTVAVIDELRQLQEQSVIKSSSSDTTMVTSTTITEQTTIQESKESSFPLSCSALSAMAYNFASFIHKIHPAYLAVAYDSRTSHRKAIYPEYKEQRKRSPIELMPQFELASYVLEALGCPCFQVEGYEADDVMASLSKWCRARGLSVVIVSLDKDMLQVIDEGIHVMDPRNLNIISKETVLEKYGVLPSQLCDWLALTGDTVDNIPGVEGVGSKTATWLLQTFGSIEKMFEELRLPPLPPSAVNLQTTTDRKLLIASLREQLSPEHYQQIITRLQEMYYQKTSRKKAVESIVAELYRVGLKQLLLYKQIIRLSDDLPLVKKPLVSSSITANAASIDPVPLQSSQELRYRGEAKNSPMLLEQQLVKNLSSSLSMPLQLLRQSYYKLDRE